MKLKTAIFAVLLIVLTSMLATHYYAHYKNRALIFKYVSDSVGGVMIQVEDHVVSELEKKTPSNIQKILDKTRATHRFISSISYTEDGNTIKYSSDRTLKGSIIRDGYISVDRPIYDELLKENALFCYTLNYFDDGTPKKAYILLHIDKDYLFKTIEDATRDNTREVFAFQFVVLTLLLLLGLHLFAKPIYDILDTAEMKNTEYKKFFIQDFTLLQTTLVNSFKTLISQKEELTQTLEQTNYLDEILRTVADVNQLLISSKSIDELLQKSCDRLSEFGHYKLVWIGFEEDGYINVAYKSFDWSGYLDEGFRISLDPADLTSKGPSANSIIENRTVITDIYDPNFKPWFEKAKKAGFRFVIAMPLRKDMHSKPFGALTVYTDREDGFDKKEILMLEELAGDIGFAINSFRQNEAFKSHLIHDSLTGLTNRIILFDELPKYKEPKVAIVNIDRLEDINEVYGFNAGDSIIKMYAGWLAEQTKEVEGSKLYKLSGGEYAILFDENTDEEKIFQFIEKLIADTDDRSFIYEEIEIFITITVGYAKSASKPIEYAEIALKKAKSKNRHFESFDTSMQMLEEQKNNIIWHKTIKTAIKEDKIVPYFQPIVNNKTGEIEKYEALMRLHTLEGKVVTPYAFLEISKKMRLYPELTKIMVNKTIDVFKTSDLPVSINLSFDDIIEQDIQEFLFEKISNTKMGEKIIFEILESEGIKSYDEVKSFINTFRSLGCSFAIDDFGSGYSNFDHILKLNIDTLKIDGSLIRNLPYDRNAQIIVASIQNFAREMGIKTVAEFVCDEDVFMHVKSMGIDSSQGYYFYEPSPNLIL
jgi:diguanylate cyclase (GGDEF)-like protein